MMKFTAADLLYAYMKNLTDGFSVQESHAEDSCVVSTPFLNRHNDAIEVYVENVGGEVCLSDDGCTLLDLRASGIDVEAPEIRRRLFVIANGFGIDVRMNVLLVKCSHKEVGEAFHRLIQSIVGVNYLYLMVGRS